MIPEHRGQLSCKTDGQQCVYESHHPSGFLSVCFIVGGIDQLNMWTSLLGNYCKAFSLSNHAVDCQDLRSRGNESLNVGRQRCEWKRCWVFLRGCCIFVCRVTPEVIVSTTVVALARWQGSVLIYPLTNNSRIQPRLTSGTVITCFLLFKILLL